MEEYRLSIADIDDIAYRTGFTYEEVELIIEEFLRKLKAKGYVIRRGRRCRR